MGRALPGPDDYEQIPALAERGRARTARFFEMLDRHLAGRRFVASDRYTIADIMALVTVNFASRINLAIPEDCSHLRRWHETVSAPERRRLIAGSSERRPAMMLSELIACSTQASQRPERSELRPSAHEPISRSPDARV